MGMLKQTTRAAIAIVAAFGLIGLLGAVGFNQALAPLQVSQTIDTDHVFVKGSDVQPDSATVTLTLNAPQMNQRLSADVMLVIDRSASFPVQDAVSAAQQLISNLGPDDQVGLVSFATDATLDAPLTPASQPQSVLDALGKLKAEGKTSVGEGIAVAADELRYDGRKNAVPVEVLLTDGRSNYGRDPLAAAKNAASQGILIDAVGIGDFPNSALLTDIAQATGGDYYSTFSSSILDQILRVDIPQNGQVATNVQIIETLQAPFSYEKATRNPPTKVMKNADSTTSLVWSLGSVKTDSTWIAKFTVSATQSGTYSLQESPSQLSYTDFRGRAVQQDLPDLQLQVRPQPPLPQAQFSYSPSDPTHLDQIQFQDDSTVGSGGTLTGWHWDFGDGSTSSEQNPTHTYAKDGQYDVKLTVTTERGAQSTATRTLSVSTPMVKVRRTIDTYIPTNQTIPGQTVRVTLDIQINAALNGLGIDENVPNGWTVTPVDNSDGTLRSDELQWLFPAALSAGTHKTIVYDVTVPSDAKASVYSIDGAVSSASPQMSIPVQGDSQVQVLSGFPITVVLAHWDTSQQALDLQAFPDHTINKNQMLQAIAWWKEGVEVPMTQDASGNKQTIDFKTIQSLVAYWLTDTSVFNGLPQPATSGS